MKPHGPVATTKNHRSKVRETFNRTMLRASRNRKSDTSPPKKKPLRTEIAIDYTIITIALQATNCFFFQQKQQNARSERECLAKDVLRHDLRRTGYTFLRKEVESEIADFLPRISRINLKTCKRLDVNGADTGV